MSKVLSHTTWQAVNGPSIKICPPTQSF